MVQQRFDIVFCGETRDGRSTEQVCAALARLFKQPAERVATLFNGRPHVLKRDLSDAEAQRYRTALNQAGAEVQLRESGADGAADTDVMTYDWSIAPLGEILRRHERRRVQAVKVPAVNWTLASVFDSPQPPARPAPPVPDTSALSLGPVGADLVPASSTPPPPPPDTTGITLAPEGTELLRPDERRPSPQTPPIDADFELVQPTGGDNGED